MSHQMSPEWAGVLVLWWWWCQDRHWWERRAETRHSSGVRGHEVTRDPAWRQALNSKQCATEREKILMQSNIPIFCRKWRFFARITDRNRNLGLFVSDALNGVLLMILEWLTNCCWAKWCFTRGWHDVKWKHLVEVGLHLVKCIWVADGAWTDSRNYWHSCWSKYFTKLPKVHHKVKGIYINPSNLV